jgi:hypothetical protein
MKLKIEVTSIEWWYWCITLIAIITGLSGIVEGFYVVIAVSVVQYIHFTIKNGATAFPTQLRLAYGLFMIMRCLTPRVSSTGPCW